MQRSPHRLIYIVLSLVFYVSCTNDKKQNANVVIEEGEGVEAKGNRGIINVGMKASRYDTDYALASQFIDENKFDKAIEIYQRLSEVEEKDLQTYVYLGLGTAFFLNKEYDDAITSYYKSLSLDSLNSNSLIGLGSTYFETKDFKNSVTYYEKAKAIDHTNSSSYWGLALCYDEMGNKLEAKENAKKFIEMEPKSRYRSVIEDILND